MLSGFELYPRWVPLFRDEVDIKEAKSFGWIKEYAPSGPKSQILATPAQSFPELTRAFPNP